MTESEYANFVVRQRAIGRRAVRDLCYDLRVELWPDKRKDPMYAEDFVKRPIYLGGNLGLAVTF